MSNTLIQFKRSSNTSIPPNGALASGQPGYSFLSDMLFMGNSAGNGILTVGGNVFVQKISTAASANGSNTLVMRDLSGDFAARHITAIQIIGNASSANTLSPGRFIASDGDLTGNVAFDGSQNINLALVMASTGVGAGSYGSTTQVPTFTVDAKGRITQAANVAISVTSTFTVQANTGTDPLSSGDFLNLVGNNGIVTALTANTGNTTVSIQLDSSVVRTVGDQTITGIKTFSNDMVLSGNLTIAGTRTFANTSQLDIGDNIIVLNADLPIGSAPAENAGVEVNLGSRNGNASIVWDFSNQYWIQSTNTLSAAASTRLFHDGYANATSMSIGIIPIARFTGAASPTEGQIMQIAANGAQMWSSIDGGAF